MAASLPSFASPHDLLEYLGLSTSDENRPRAARALAHASAAIRVEAGRTWTDEDTGELAGVPVGIAELTVQVAARHWANPTGIESENTGPVGVRYGSVHLTDAERATVQRAAGGGRPAPGLFTIQTSGGESVGTVWVPTAPGPGPLFPFLDVGDL